MNLFPSYKTGKLSINLLILMSIICAPAALGLATANKIFILPTLAITVLAAGIFLLRHPEIFFWGIVFTAPVSDHLAINLGPFNVRPYNLLAAGAAVWLILLIICRKFKNPVLKNAINGFPWFLPLLLLSLIKVLGSLNASADYLYIPLKFPLKFSILASLSYLSCYVVYCFCITERKVEIVVSYWLHLSNFIIALAIIQLILSNVAGFHYVHHRQVIWFGRPYSVFREPDVLGSFVAATAIMIIPLLVFKAHVVKRRYLYFTLASNVFMMIILLVRAAWLGFMVTFVFTYLSFVIAQSEHKVRPYLNRATALAILGMVALPILMPSLAESLFGRFVSIGKPKAEGASAYRMMELEHMVEKCLPNKGIQSQVNFLVGHGDFTWSYWGPELAGDAYNQDSKTSATVLIHPGYCMMLTYLFDNGIVGALLVLIFFLIMALRYKNLLGDPYISEKYKALLMATFLPQAVILICFQFSYDPITPFMWILTGIHVACANLAKLNIEKTKAEKNELNNNRLHSSLTYN